MFNLTLNTKLYSTKNKEFKKFNPTMQTNLPLWAIDMQ
jgi:hypothetical protein